MKRQARQALSEFVCRSFVGGVRGARRFEQMKEFVRQNDFGDLCACEPMLFVRRDRQGGESFDDGIVQRDLQRPACAFGEEDNAAIRHLPRGVRNAYA